MKKTAWKENEEEKKNGEKKNRTEKRCGDRIENYAKYPYPNEISAQKGSVIQFQFGLHWYGFQYCVCIHQQNTCTDQQYQQQQQLQWSRWSKKRNNTTTTTMLTTKNSFAVTHIHTERKHILKSPNVFNAYDFDKSNLHIDANSHLKIKWNFVCALSIWQPG